MYSEKNRRTLIQDALIGMMNIYPVDTVSLFPFVDMLHLLIQEPVCISFFEKTRSKTKPCRLTYTSLQDPELKPQFLETINRDAGLEKALIPLPGSKYYVCLHRINMLDRHAGTQYHTETSKIFKELFSDLKKNSHGNQVLEIIKRGLKLHPEAESAGTPEAEGRPVFCRDDLNDIEDVDAWSRGLLQPMRRVLDDAYADIMTSPMIYEIIEQGKPRRRLDFSNMSCVVRTATNMQPRRGVFNYTARILLSPGQKLQVENWCTDFETTCCFKKGFSCSLGGAQKCALGNLDWNSRTDEVCKRLEIPLGTNSRSIADSVFCSGLIDFSAEMAGEGRDASSEPSLNDMLRREMEQCIYSQITASPHVFYIPVHVSGVPWLALFTLSPLPSRKTGDSLSWAHNYQVYRSLIPQITTRLRAGARQAYLQLVGEALYRNLDGSDGHALIDRVNREWLLLTYVYPFSRLELLPQGHDNAARLELPDKKTAWIHMHIDNRNFYRQVPFDLLDLQDVVAECRKRVDQFVLTRHRNVQTTKQEISLLTTHDLRSTLNNAVVDPLNEVISRLGPRPETIAIKEKIKDAKACVENYCTGLSYLMDGFADLFTPEELLQEEDYQQLAKNDLNALITSEYLILEKYPALPHIEVILEGFESIVLNITKRSFRALLHMIVSNAIDAMNCETMDLQSQKIQIKAVPLENTKNFCELSVWNSGTSFTQPVIDQAGLRPYTTRLGRQRSGLGLYILEKVLDISGAGLQQCEKHFRLENTHNPDGAQIVFAIPIQGGSHVE